MSGVQGASADADRATLASPQAPTGLGHSESIPSALLYRADCRQTMPQRGPVDMILADPPYGDTSLAWDKRVKGWQKVAADVVKPTGSMWVFGSFRYFLAEHRLFEAAGWRLAQEIVWEKHNGSSFHADRFKRVHEIAAHYYPAETPWEQVYNEVQTTADATPRTVRRKQRPAHTGHIEAGTTYVSEDGGPRIMRSVIAMRSCHGFAIHPTEKPVGLLSILIRTSCPSGGVVGDFFAGSGAAAEAALDCGRSYVGCEIDVDYHAKASARLAGQLFGYAPASGMSAGTAKTPQAVEGEARQPGPQGDAQ